MSKRNDLGPSANQAFFATVNVVLAVFWLIGFGFAGQRAHWTDWLIWLGPPFALGFTAPFILFGWNGALEVFSALVGGIGESLGNILNSSPHSGNVDDSHADST